jgi:hypothetical protein
LLEAKDCAVRALLYKIEPLEARPIERQECDKGFDGDCG